MISLLRRPTITSVEETRVLFHSRVLPSLDSAPSLVHHTFMSETIQKSFIEACIRDLDLLAEIGANIGRRSRNQACGTHFGPEVDKLVRSLGKHAKEMGKVAALREALIQVQTTQGSLSTPYTPDVEIAGTHPAAPQTLTVGAKSTRRGSPNR